MTKGIFYVGVLFGLYREYTWGSIPLFPTSHQEEESLRQKWIRAFRVSKVFECFEVCWDFEEFHGLEGFEDVARLAVLYCSFLKQR